MKHVRTVARLPYPAESVWQILTDFPHYSEWNPLNIQAIGEAKLGSQVHMRIAHPLKPGKIVVQTVTITEFVPGRRLGWRGHFPFVFTGEHYFELVREGASTLLLHGERISGLFALALSRADLEQRFTPAYERANVALLERLSIVASPP